MRRWEYAVVVEEVKHLWTLWLQEQQGPGESLTQPIRRFGSDLDMLSHMSSKRWELVTSINMQDGLPRLIFKRQLD